MDLKPKTFLNTPAGARIPVYGDDQDWNTVAELVRKDHPKGGHIMDGYGMVFVNEKGLAVAIAGEPSEKVMSKVRNGEPFPLGNS